MTIAECIRTEFKTEAHVTRRLLDVPLPPVYGPTADAGM
jgi:hypothetical protein